MVDDADLPVLARLLRAEREAAQLTREEAAQIIKVSKGLIYAWERQGRTPSAETLEAFLNGLEVPQWRRPKYAALAQPLLNQLNWDMSPVVTPDDQLGLDRNLDPACYHDDAFDLYAANQPLRARFPGLVAPAPDATVRPNLLEWVVRDPAAKKVIRNWEERATVMANAFLIVAPGRIPERRIQQIISSCEQAPEWPEISRIRATDEHVLNQRIYLWDPETECYENRIITAYTFKYPPRPYNVLVLQATVPQS
jgi:transcriptional regulator with XRE-family HTH domain